MAEPAKAEPKPVVPLNVHRPKTLQIGSLQAAEHKRNLWVGDADPEATLEEMLKPEFWIHDARKFKPRDEIEVWAKDGSWLEVFVVRSVVIPDVGKSVVKVIRKDDVPRSDDKLPEPKPIAGVVAKWRGPHSKWGAVRESDQEVIKDKFETREDAEAWIKETLKG